MGLSRRAYADHRKALGLSGTSEAAVRKALLAGRITALPDGTIDPAAADREWGGSTSAAKVRSGRPIEAESYRLDEDEQERPIIIASPTAGMDEKSAATLNQVKIAQEKLKLDEALDKRKLRKGELMQRQPARKFVFALGKLYSTSLRAHHSVAGAALAARFGIREHDMIQALRDEYAPFLEALSKEDDDLDNSDKGTSRA